MSECQSYKSLSEKQIIKQLKCLVAKQQEAINSLVKEIQTLKNQNSKDKNLNEKMINSKQQNSSRNYNCQKFSIKPFQSQQIRPEAIQISNIQKIFKEFHSSVYQPLEDKYLLNTPRKEFPELKIPFSHKNKNISGKNISFKNISSFTEFIPTFLNQIKNLLKHIDALNNKKQQKQKDVGERIKSQQKVIKQQQNSLKQIFRTLKQKQKWSKQQQRKIIQQQRTIKQMIIEYEKNIQQSQVIENKLVLEIQKLRKANKLSIPNNNFNSKQYRSQLYN